MEDTHAHHDSLTKERIISDVKQYGWHVGWLTNSNYVPDYAMTIGLYKSFGHPEIIIFGLKPEVMHHILNDVGSKIKDGEFFKPNQDYKDLLNNYSVRFVEVLKDYYDQYLGYCNWFNGKTLEYPCLQLVWPDFSGHYPWEEEFNESWYRMQPLLNRDPGFKFLEKPNWCVYTTQSVVDGKPILRVYHNLDGEWQFHHEEYPNASDGRLVPIKSLVDKDAALNDLIHLEKGQYAERRSEFELWEVFIDEEE